MGLNKPYSLGLYNKFDDREQWIRITEGCPHNCPFCFEPQEFKLFPIPEIVRNQVRIMDMNLLAKPEALQIIMELGERKVNSKVVNYELICGVDYRFLTKEIAISLHASRFRNIRIAWDWYYSQQRPVKEAIYKLLNAGYTTKDLMIFMICNWKIPYNELKKKLELCKYWNVQVADCYFDGQVKNIKPVFWTAEEIRSFRRQVRKHNQICNFKIDPEFKKQGQGVLI